MAVQRVAPLADQVRPTALAQFHGQAHLLQPGQPLYRALTEGLIHSMVFWGPPGTGKTTLARMLCESANAAFVPLSAVLGGVKEIRAAVEEARQHQASGLRTVVFVDEVHRFNKSQQDAFLPHVEDGTIIFVGATTENPAFELNNALLSRVRVYALKSLEPAALRAIIDQALADIGPVQMEDSLRDRLATTADGDARRALNLLELACELATDGVIDLETMKHAAEGVETRRFDKRQDDFFDQISALHKSVRGSNPDAALYWFARMLDGGCDPTYIARRVARIASEDIGNADPRALGVAMDAWEAWRRLGTPEGELALAQALVYCACAPKSNAVYRAFNQAMQEVQSRGSDPVPVHIRNAPTTLAKAQGHGADYRYDHDEPGAFSSGQTYFPEALGERTYYEPVNRGMEIQIGEKLARLRRGGSKSDDEK